MPRKVLIDKKTLQEILEKYQGGGSSTAGGSGKLYQLSFKIKLYDLQGDLVEYLAGLGVDATFMCGISESNFERFKAMVNPLLEAPISTINDLVNFINGMNETVGFESTWAADTYSKNTEYAFLCSLLAVCDNATCVYDVSGGSDMQIGNVLVGTNIGIMIAFDSSASMPVPFADSYDNEGTPTWYYYGVNTDNSCALTEYGTSASGATVEAEPIVSIKMTNMDCRDLDADPQKIRDIQFYCTKERWNNMVSMAKTLADVDITYVNFGTIYSSLPVGAQSTLIGALLMDYYDGKVLPKAFSTHFDTLDYNMTVAHFMADSILAQEDGIKFVFQQEWGDEGGAGYYFPNTEDRTTTPYTTADTVITVEEIDGASIGSSSGSGSSAELPKYYEMVFNLTPTAGVTTDYSICFHLTEENLDLVIDSINQGLQQMGMSITVTKDNWDTVVNQMLANPTQQLLLAFMQVLQYILLVSTNHIYYDYDGAGTDIYIASIGFIKIGSNGDNMLPYHTTLLEITNHY